VREKRFHLPAERIRPIAEGRGSCIATDMITVAGQRVGYMYREEPGNPSDSGWRFFSGTESQAFVDDPANLELYDVNTIANYDPEIVPLLDAQFPVAFARDARGAFVEVDPP
jgi:hypothetical protein